MLKKILSVLKYTSKSIKDVYKISFYVIILTLLELLGISLVFPFIDVLINENKSDIFINLNILELNFRNFIIIATFIFLIIFVIRTIMAIILQKKIIDFIMDVQVDLRQSILHKLTLISIDNYKSKSHSEHILEITALIGHYTVKGLMPVVRLSADIFIVITLFIYMLNKSFILTLIVLIVSSIFIYILSKRVGSRYQADGKIANLAYKKVIDLTGSFVNGLHELIINNKSNIVLKRINNETNKMALYEGKNQLINIIPKYSLELIIIFVFVTSIVLINIFSIDKVNSYGNLVLFLIIGIKLLPAFLNFIQVIINLSFFENSVTKIDNALSLPVFNEKIYTINKFNKIQISNASLSINGRKLFNEFNMEINNGNKLAICGPSGSGKSTLLEILLGLRSFDSGEVIIDSKKINNQYFSLSDICTYVPQNPVILNSTIYENLMIDNKSINHEQIFTYLKKMKLHNRLGNDPLNFIISDDGKTLSGGEKQRLALLRALLSSKKLILVDEVTSALDDDIAFKLMSDMIDVFKERSIIAVTHSSKIASLFERKIYI